MYPKYSVAKGLNGSYNGGREAFRAQVPVISRSTFYQGVGAKIEQGALNLNPEVQVRSLSSR